MYHQAKYLSVVNKIVNDYHLPVDLSFVNDFKETIVYSPNSVCVRKICNENSIKSYAQFN